MPVKPSENVIQFHKFAKKRPVAEEAIFILDASKNVIFANDLAQQMLSERDVKELCKNLDLGAKLALNLEVNSKVFDVITNPIEAEGSQYLLISLRQALAVVKDEPDKGDEKLRAMFDHCFELIGLCDVEGRLLEINEPSLKLGNLKREDVIGEYFWNTFWALHFAHPQYRRQLIEAWPQAQSGEFVRFEFSGSFSSGEILTFDFSLTPVLNEKGKVKFIVPEGRDITQLKKLHRELEQVNDRLASANADLEDFAMVVSHDLRQPLQSVAMGVALLNRKLSQEAPSDLSKYMSFVSDGVSRMNLLLDSILEYSVSTKASEQKEMVSCRQVLSEVLDNLAKLIEESRAQIRLDPLPRIRAHRTQLARVFQNLISNALKFRDIQRPLIVTISAKAEAEAWVFSVSDTGIGIASEGINKLFRMFSRLDVKEQYPGMGVGLTICKKIIERHGGKIWVESKLGHGTTFYFRLPHVEKEN